MTDFVIRHAEPADLPTLNDVYNHYISTTPITFDIEPWTLDKRQEWFGHYHASGRHQLFVAVATSPHEVVGYASSSVFRPKAAYETSVETSVYLSPGWTRLGVGGKLYERLFASLAREDVHRAFAGITLPNPASVALHERFGFRPIGVFTHAGRKLDQYWDVIWYEKRLG
jgi:phosphinothricin acetyltransferase